MQNNYIFGCFVFASTAPVVIFICSKVIETDSQSQGQINIPEAYLTLGFTVMLVLLILNSAFSFYLPRSKIYQKPLLQKRII